MKEEDGKKVRPHWTRFRSEVKIQQSERDKRGSMEELKQKDTQEHLDDPLN